MQRLKLASGDILLLITDGVTEAENEHQARYGAARAIECLRPGTRADAAAACVRLHADVKEIYCRCAAVGRFDDYGDAIHSKVVRSE